MSSRVLIIFGTSYGQTEKIAVRIAGDLQSRGFPIELCNAASGKPSMPLEEYTAIVVGGSIIARGHQPSIKQFVRSNVEALNRLPSAFFQVSASAGSAAPDSRAAAQRILDDFLRELGWTPVLSASIAGAINYTHYSFLLRWFMKRASAKNGGSTDTSKDHEYTNWAQVDRFAAAIAAAISPKPVLRPPEPALRA
ncbi:MAG TPA: flavodoxin domain-containing protein [Gemmatimonadaceae bacterium]